MPAAIAAGIFLLTRGLMISVANHSHNSLILQNAKVVLPDRVLARGGIQIEAGRIARIFDSSEQVPVSESSVDLAGTTLFPGFIDLHIHGAVGVDVNSASVDDLRRVSEFLTSKGVTAWLPTLVPAPAERYEQAVRTIETAARDQERRLEYRLQSGFAEREKDPTEVGTLNTCGARVLGVHYEGPFVNSDQCGALHREHFRKFKSAADLDSLPTIANGNAVHMMTVAPEIDGGIEFIRELLRRAWIVSFGDRAG